MAAEKPPTGKDLDRALDLEEARLSERVRQRQDSHEDEDSAVINQRALEQTKQTPTPPRYRLVQRVVDRLPPWGLVLVLMAIVAAVAGTGAWAKLSGWP